MARKLRVEYEGAIYHVMNRGDREEPIYLDDEDARRFVEALGQVCKRTDWEVHAYCLMTNHFHLVVETPRANLVAGMKWLLGTYTSRFNRRHGCVGHLFSGRYKSLIVDGSGTEYLRTVCRYVHMNPSRAGLLGPEEPLKRYPWSSIGEFLKTPKRRARWVRVDRVFGDLGIGSDSLAGRRQFERVMESQREEDEPESFTKIRRGWCLGPKEFRKGLLEEMAAKATVHHYGADRRESSEAKAKRILKDELKRLRWTEADLAEERKGHAKKIAIAKRLRSETTMTMVWIAEHTQMGSESNVRKLLNLTHKKKK
jgi:putative transposase